MFDEVNDFGIVVNFPSKKDGTGDVIDYHDFVRLASKKRLTLFQFLIPATAFLYVCVSVQLFG